MWRACHAGLGLALLLAMAGEVAAQAQRLPQQRAQPVQSVQPAPPAEPQPSPPESSPSPQGDAAPDAAPPLAGAPPLLDQRQQGPVSIRVIPTPKTEQELIAEQQDRAQRSGLESNLMLLVIALVVIGFLQLLVMAVQGIFLLVGMNAMRRPMEMVERTLAVAQRAFVHVGSMAASSAGGHLKVTPTLENGGSTPTRSLRVSTNWRAVHGDLPSDFVYNYTVPPARIFLAARGRAPIGSVEIPLRDVQAALEERLHLYVWGRATYEDMFEGSEPHFIEFCFRLGVTGTLERPSVSFMPDGPHNRTEQDSHRLLSPEKASGG